MTGSLILRRLYEPALAQAAYLVACQRTGTALIVDPTRDVGQYLKAAEEEHVRIVAVTETHIHADFVSGSRELARRTDATLYLSGEAPPDWRYAFAQEPNVTTLRDGDSFDIGRISISIMHVPGHTPEHLAFLVTDLDAATEPMGVLTGDSLFVGDVGRPDLLVRTRRDGSARGAAATSELDASSRAMYRTVARFALLPDHLQVWPGHGAGSACGKSLSAVPQSTIGYERRFNWAFGVADETEFVARILDGQPDPPRYFGRMKQINRDGPPAFPVPPSTTPMEPEAIGGLQRGGVVLVDTRPAREFAAGHLPGSINVPLGGSFATWAGSVLSADAVIALLVEDGEGAAAGAIRALALIGIDEVRGVFDRSLVDAARAADGLATLTRFGPADLVGRRDDLRIVDVRSTAEWNAGHIAGAIHAPLAELPEAMDRIPAGPVVLHCEGGTRSVVAASALQAAGRSDVADLEGGMAAWRRAGLPVVAGRTADAAEEAPTP